MEIQEPGIQSVKSVPTESIWMIEMWLNQVIYL